MISFNNENERKMRPFFFCYLCVPLIFVVLPLALALSHSLSLSLFELPFVCSSVVVWAREYRFHVIQPASSKQFQLHMHYNE